MTAATGIAIVIVAALGLLAGALLWAAGTCAMAAYAALREGDDQC